MPLLQPQLRGIECASVQDRFQRIGAELQGGGFVVVAELRLQPQDFVQRADGAFHA
jgi:hypothetical protein